jgi:hypothetical protein
MISFLLCRDAPNPSLCDEEQAQNIARIFRTAYLHYFKTSAGHLRFTMYAPPAPDKRLHLIDMMDFQRTSRLGSLIDNTLRMLLLPAGKNLKQKD